MSRERGLPPIEDELAARRERKQLEDDVRQLARETDQPITDAAIRACGFVELIMTAFALRRMQVMQKYPFYMDGI